MKRFTRFILLLGSVVLPLFDMTAISLAAEKPDWVDGPSENYPEASFLIGVGSGDTRQRAEESAYAALARIFRAEIRSATHEREDFRQTEKGKRIEIDRTIDLRNQTEVSTQKVLEQVRIAERWTDSVSKVHYALAVLDRAKSASALRQKSLDAEVEAREWETRAKKSADPLEQARALHKALLAARQTELYESDLRIIQPTGRGDGLKVSAAAIDDQLKALLNRSFKVNVQIDGPQATAVRDAILAGLHDKGFTSGGEGDLLIKGNVGLEEADLKDPKWHYIRWSADLTLTQKEGQKEFGRIQRSGKEGHLTPKEAERKALSALQKELSETVGDTVLKLIYGE
ncbi:MAG: LPP20 family lipoprotein [Candidatus Manganitrophus sp.]|nr:LPP20 family lipoprotein [Candidatus Manganitrophus sp.]MDC4223672.1 LPP20 family lipoprotein [Candidatus Manganitrophus sp.]WDT70069.1 MAG: LPP20 family lipoprotein [Candidatus Manganitrophus sp.]WDT78278.1 MAG: LPP20 family lipoprotein [Candidatus Manganitrophus sp.]